MLRPYYNPILLYNANSNFQRRGMIWLGYSDSSLYMDQVHATYQDHNYSFALFYRKSQQPGTMELVQNMTQVFFAVKQYKPYANSVICMIHHFCIYCIGQLQ